jgi:hypothetical protein
MTAVPTLPCKDGEHVIPCLQLCHTFSHTLHYPITCITKQSRDFYWTIWDLQTIHIMLHKYQIKGFSKVWPISINQSYIHKISNPQSSTRYTDNAQEQLWFTVTNRFQWYLHSRIDFLPCGFMSENPWEKIQLGLS